jgi:hypothetical protein
MATFRYVVDTTIALHALSKTMEPDIVFFAFLQDSLEIFYLK